MIYRWRWFTSRTGDQNEPERIEDSEPHFLVAPPRNYDQCRQIQFSGHTGTPSARGVASQKTRLSPTVGRVPIQRVFELSRDRRWFEVAGQNFAIRRIAGVEFSIGFPIRTKRRAFQRDAREQSARTGIR